MVTLRGIIYVFCLLTTCWKVESLSYERQIYNTIFTGYSTELRPLQNSSESLRIELKFELTKINQIDDVNQRMEVVGFMIAEWKDEYLVWNASDYGDTDRLVVPATKVWLPDFAIVNSADTFYQESFVDDFRVLIRSTGEVIWSFGGNFVVSCELDLTYYPFDEQMCFILIENWQYDQTEVELVNSTSEVEKDEYHKNGMWTLVKTVAHGGLIYHAAFPGVAYPIVKFELFMMRKSGYFVLNIVCPCLLLAILALLVFLLPPDSGEKVGLGITIILAFSVFALLIAQSTPQTSDSFPLISVWICVLIIISSLNTVVTIAVLHFHHHLPATMPRFVRALFLGTIARLLCMSSDMPQIPSDDDVEEIDTVSIESDIESLKKQSLAIENRKGNIAYDVLVDRVDTIMKLLAGMTRSIKEKEKDSTLTDQWMALARVIDRICFWLNFIIILVSTILCLSLRGSTPSE